MGQSTSKLKFDSERTRISVTEAIATITDILHQVGCREETTSIVAHHLVDTSLSGVESHGITRILSYAKAMQDGSVNPQALPELMTTDTGIEYVEGNRGIGIPAMQLAYERGISIAQTSGISVIPGSKCRAYRASRVFRRIRCSEGLPDNLHWRRQSQKMEAGRPLWRQTGRTPHKSSVHWHAGWRLWTRSRRLRNIKNRRRMDLRSLITRGSQLPDDCIIDRDGNPTNDPNDYLNGGAILPAGEHKGYGLAVIGELIAEALLGPTTIDCNWLIITLDTKKFGTQTAIQNTAEEILNELRTCPPASGFDQVEIPGERERDEKRRSDGTVLMPERTWRHIRTLHANLSAEANPHDSL